MTEDCRNCGQPIKFHGTTKIAGTGPLFTEHWRHVSESKRHCDGGLGSIAERRTPCPR